MRSKNHHTMTAAERDHIAKVKELPCSVCDQPGPSEAHHIEQESHFTTVALCTSCHTGSLLGWHGQKRMWAVRKMNELDALGVTVRRLMGVKEPA